MKVQTHTPATVPKDIAFTPTGTVVVQREAASPVTPPPIGTPVNNVTN